MERKFKTKDQKKIERLEEKLTEKEVEISQLKKDRKRLNYAVERLENEKVKAKDISSSNDIQKIKELNAQIKQLETSIEEMELEMAKQDGNSKSKINMWENTAKFWQRKHDDLCKQIEAEHNAYYEEKICDLILNRKGIKERNEILNAYENGDLYYTITENGEQNEYPIFSPRNLFIQIHPKTGLPLTKENFKVLDKWAYLQFDYQYYIAHFRDYLLNKNPSEKAKIQSAYNIGKELLPLYEHLLF